LRAVGEQIAELKFAESCQRQIEAATPSCLPLHACRKMRDLSFGMGPGIFRIRDQPVDRPALDLIRRPHFPSLARALWRARKWGS